MGLRVIHAFLDGPYATWVFIALGWRYVAKTNGAPQDAADAPQPPSKDATP